MVGVTGEKAGSQWRAATALEGGLHTHLHERRVARLAVERARHVQPERANGHEAQLDERAAPVGLARARRDECGQQVHVEQIPQADLWNSRYVSFTQL